MNTAQRLLMGLIVSLPLATLTSESEQSPKHHVTRTETPGPRGTVVTYTSTDGRSACYIPGTNIYTNDLVPLTRIARANQAHAICQLHMQWDQQQKAKIAAQKSSTQNSTQQ